MHLIIKYVICMDAAQCLVILLCCVLVCGDANYTHSTQRSRAQGSNTFSHA